MSLQPGSPIGRYVVKRKLAEGGMAEIYLCSSVGPEGFQKEVAIKRVRPALADDPAFVQMFISEARLASRLNHPNLVHIFDFDKHDDTYYLAMEYVRGRSLWELRKRCKELLLPVPPTIAAEAGRLVARGLHYAHRLTEGGQPLRLVHRDVTPHNVLLSYDGAVKLTDFGIAKAGNRLTATGALKGKFAYMSPEQARGEPVDSRTDVFALGILLWELVTGGRLFDDDSDVAVLKAVQERAIPEPARLNPDVDASLNAAIMRALERRPDTRFQTAQELERALQQYLLSAAKAVEDTDVGAFLRRAFTREGGSPDALLEPTASGGGAPTRHDEPRSGPLPGAVSLPIPALADDDAFADTYVVSRRAPAMGEELRAATGPTLRGVSRGRLWPWAAAASASLLVGAAVTLRPARAPRLTPGAAERTQAAAPTEPQPRAAASAPAPSGASALTEGARELRPGAEQAPGDVVFKAQPWAKVVVDGRSEEVEGVRRLKLAPGAHLLRFSKSGRQLSFEVEEGRTRVVDLNTERIIR